MSLPDIHSVKSNAPGADDISAITPANFVETLDVEVPSVISVPTTATAVFSAIDDDVIEKEFDPEARNINACILTFFPPDTGERWLDPTTYTLPCNLSDIKTWAGQFEDCPTTGRLHAHILVEFGSDNRQRFTSVRNMIYREVRGTPCTSVHILKPRGHWNPRNRQFTLNYVLKPIHNGRHKFIWEGCADTTKFCQQTWDNKADFLAKKKKRKISRSEARIKEIRQFIDSYPPTENYERIVHSTEEGRDLLCNCGWGKVYHNGRSTGIPERLITEVVVAYGAGATGKTTLARKYDARPDEPLKARLYKRNPLDGIYWGGNGTTYRGQRILHCEEFNGQEPFHVFKQICEVGLPGPNVNVKNGGITLNHEIIFFTSNHHPADWYRNVFEADSKQWLPFARRFTKILFFPDKLPDGTPNRPGVDGQDEIHFVDQTEEWRTIEDSYAEAKLHADTYWPLSVQPGMPDGNGAFARNFNPQPEHITDFFRDSRARRATARRYA